MFGFTLMSYIIQYMTTHGVPELSLAFFLMLPVAATLISFARQVLGIKAFGLYIPLITTFAFLATGIKYGVFLFLIIVVTGTLFRYVLRKARLLYLPRMALTLILITISIYIIFVLAVYLGKTSFIQVSIFPVLILIILSEKFINTQIRLGNKIAIISTIETLLISIACYYLISWQSFQNIALQYPLIFIAVTIIINILLGRWAGLRISEFFRFKEVIDYIEVPKK